jgi:uncharacterized protein YdiU (UPF0061 family)
MQFDNRYARLPEQFYARVTPQRVSAPSLLAWNAGLAEELGLQAPGDDSERLARIFSGNQVPDGAEPVALAYAGHQFGNFVPQLGDGRALLLGEVVTADGRRLDVQLKGSGQTPFSRGGDGKAAIGPVIREYLVSEAMHRLGVPTTRALAAVRTGESVWREQMLPGAVLTRVAASHIRVGTFEYFAARRDTDALQVLLEHAIARHYPEAAQAESPALAFFAGVLQRQAALVAQWLSIGFIHGVMNTDNTAISGETLDYGPCAFMDEFHFDRVFSSIDRFGRYAYAQQPNIALWNLTRLAECLMLLGEPQEAFEEQLTGFEELFRGHYLARMRAKLGLLDEEAEDAALITDWLQHVQDNRLDFTLGFRRLADSLTGEEGVASGGVGKRWRERVGRQPQSARQIAAHMHAVNPLVIPRNHQIERVIQAAIAGDLEPFEQMQRALQSPYEPVPGLEDFAEPPREEERVTETFCGT